MVMGVYKVLYSTIIPWPHGKMSRAADLGSIPAFDVDLYHGRVMPVTEKLASQWLPCRAPGMVVSALGLAGPVSQCCDRVTKQV